jgi:hypothetical protein
MVIDETVVADRLTGLTWTRDNVPGGRMTYAKAIEACAALDLGGRSWRAPTPGELLTLVDYDRHGPAINPVFRCEAAGYWTGKPYAASPGDCAWFVNFYDGLSGCYSRGHEFFVRAVCASQ